ncbi:MAG TPA: adenylate/guanylate cyclase domain-containing protein [Actinomycetota bacterium]|nr:adenylate/guanylate cyclase domain-containing protein [Actinomycetota bacterium]
MASRSGLSRDELAERAGVAPDLVDRLVRLGILTRSEGDASFRLADVYRIRLALACERAGLPIEGIGQAIAAGKLSLSYMDLPNYRWAALTPISYRELADELELPFDLVLDVVQAMGYARPHEGDRVREDDWDVFRLVRLALTVLDRDATLRSARVYADALRRIAEAEASLYDTYVVGRLLNQGMSYREAVDLANDFGAQISPMQEQFIITTYRRMQERRWTEYTIEGIEEILEEMGLYQRPERSPAFGFVDLAGYTRMTEEWGDQASARLVADLSEMVDTVARSHHGEPVKWLGDGVMVYFRNPANAVSGTVEMVRRAPEVGLPAHAGIASGPVVFQDGDYFGRTVNMAARIASHATEGQTLVSREVAELAATNAIRFREVGRVELKGFSDPVLVYEALSPE